MEIIVFWVICGIITGVVASTKARSGFGWFIIGVLLGPFGIVFIALMPSIASAEAVQSTKNLTEPVTKDRASAIKNCPDCAETVLLDAKVCKHCGYRFDGQAL